MNVILQMVVVTIHVLTLKVAITVLAKMDILYKVTRKHVKVCNSV